MLHAVTVDSKLFVGEWITLSVAGNNRYVCGAELSCCWHLTKVGGSDWSNSSLRQIISYAAAYYCAETKILQLEIFNKSGI